MTEIRVERLHEENYDELADFINMVFSQDLITVHFREDVPIAVGPSERKMNCQYVVREDGKIRAAVGSIPYTLMVGKEAFSVRVITNVATHYRHTGRGFMQTLLRAALSDMEKEGADLSILSGNRERYRYFGYETAGEEYFATFSAANIPHRKKRDGKHEYQFREVKREDDAAWERVTALYETVPMRYVRRREDLPDHVATWDSGVREIFRADGSYAGYLILRRRWQKEVEGILLRDPSELPEIMDSLLLAEALPHIDLGLNPFDRAVMRQAFESAETIHASQVCRMNLLRPERFLAACLNLKQELGGALPRGSLVLEGCVGRFEIVNDGAFTVRRTEEDADVFLPDHLFYPLFFGPCPQSAAQFPEIPGAFRSWFPVPFYIPRVDRY